MAPAAKIGIVPLVFVNDDLPELTPPIEPQTLVDEIARLGFSGTQLSRGLPQGAALRPALEARDLRIAEVYAALPCTADGPPPIAREQALEAAAKLDQVDGDVLIFSYHLSPGRVDFAARASEPNVPQLSSTGWDTALELLQEVARRVRGAGRILVYHPHIGTYVETPAEVDRLMQNSDPNTVGLCLDVGHFTAGGGDPVGAIRTYGSRIQHIHMKDVNPVVLTRLRDGSIPNFLDAIRSRLFTELGEGLLDVPAIVAELAALEYGGWLMSEQDTTWRPAAESAAIGRAVIDAALRAEAYRRTGLSAEPERVSSQ